MYSVFVTFSECKKAQVKIETKTSKVLLDSTYPRILGPVNEFQQLCSLIGGISIDVVGIHFFRIDVTC